jgi:hypothetical protein
MHAVDHLTEAPALHDLLPGCHWMSWCNEGKHNSRSNAWGRGVTAHNQGGRTTAVMV